MYGLDLVTGPAEEPVDLATFRQHCDIATDQWDGQLLAAVRAARELIEGEADRSLISQRWRLSLRDWPGRAIYLPRGPLFEPDQEATAPAVTYRDENGDWQALDAASYSVDQPTAVLERLASVTWPGLYADTSYAARVRIEYQTGFAANRAGVPERAKQAVKLLGRHFWEQPEPVVVGKSVADLPLTYRSLIAALIEDLL